MILTTRLLLFTAILFAFSQPYFSHKKINQEQETYLYLDNSLSINTKGKKGNLLHTSAQEIIENTSEANRFSLLTNSNFHENISKEELKKELLKIKPTSKKLNFESILLKLNSKNKTKSKTSHKTILISDFQNTYKNKFTNVTQPISAIQLTPSVKNNISIDSVFIRNKNLENNTVYAVIRNQGEVKKDLPIALYNDTKLISKQSFSIDKNSKKTIQFTFEKTITFLGKLEISYSDTFSFDNSFYFALNSPKKIAVLAIGNNSDYLQKIYTKEEFNLTQNSPKNINYNSISKQQLIILNELENIPSNLSSSLANFSKNGGHIVIIPNVKIDFNSYNLLFRNLHIGKINSKKNDTLKITNINYNHPLLSNVFSKKSQQLSVPKHL